MFFMNEDTIKELQEEELEQLNKSDDEIDLEELESLILEGANARIPVLIEYPKFDKKTGETSYKRYTACLKPLTNTEVNNARRMFQKSNDTSFELELLKRGLFTKDDKPFPFKLIKAMNVGVINGLGEQLLEISGVKQNKQEQKRFARELMGF